MSREAHNIGNIPDSGLTSDTTGQVSACTHISDGSNSSQTMVDPPSLKDKVLLGYPYCLIRLQRESSSNVAYRKQL